jgi:transcription elongation factor Elf1
MTYKNPVPQVDSYEKSDSDVSIGLCQFCGKDNVVIVGTPQTACYCRECHQMTIYFSQEAIRKIDAYAKENKIRNPRAKRKITVEELDELERKKDEALSKLITGKVY